MDAETKKSFDQVKEEINRAINEIAKQDPKLANYLFENIVFDEGKGTVRYIGNIKWNTLPLS